MRKSLLGILFVLLCCAGVVRAQYDAQFSQYFMATGYYNPGYAGQSENLNVFGIHRQQWVGFEGAPKSSFVMADMPIRFAERTHGIGVVMFSEKIGLSNITQAGGQYAYKKNLWGGTLSVGLQLGIFNMSFQGDSVRLPDNDVGAEADEAIPITQAEGMTFDMNAGIYYSHPKFYAGFGVSHLMEPEIGLDETAKTYAARMYNFMAGYNIKTSNPLIELQPSVFLKTEMINFQADITARLIYNKMFNGGLSWRVNESVILFLGASIGPFQVGYAYDYSYSAIRKATHGSHEIMAKFSLKLKQTKTGKNRHKSVRIL
ncbi:MULTISPECIES: type IX secretion system membrane protein PorP/SprF [unclassified Parabacteroides]|uniref:PorP/SprF family type IX secretion system membrane protein n=1 Tax=unclassified Parabacteroides TaxID=2649774 RepID=UPI0024764C2B|nr:MULTISPECIES: type IX secretion system membrane protein PorP/SprF [unclassified Parabacteroides]